MSQLINDDSGAPYPSCTNCPDQIAPQPDHIGKSPTVWAHIYSDGTNRWFLYNCQRPNEGSYGTLQNRAEPDIDDR